MTGRSHDLVSAATAFAVGQALHLEPEQQAAFVLGAVVTASQISLRWKRQRIRIGLSPDVDCVWPLNRWLDHREQTHWPHTALLVIALAFFAAWHLTPAWVLVGSAVAIGWVSHLGLDAMTLDGIPKGPGFKGQIHLLPAGFRLRTGSPVELVFQALVVLALASYVWQNPF